MTAGPCNGELRFWERVPSELLEANRQLTRIADALEKLASVVYADKPTTAEEGQA